MSERVDRLFIKLRYQEPVTTAEFFGALYLVLPTDFEFSQTAAGRHGWARNGLRESDNRVTVVSFTEWREFLRRHLPDFVETWDGLEAHDMIRQDVARKKTIDFY